MRPIEKGDSPQVFRDYKDARDPLIDRICDYCSYCERLCDPQVEHIEPQSKRPERALEWDNFLLGCMYCNPIKNDTYTGATNYFFPDEHNTAYAFVYDQLSNSVCPNPDLGGDEQTIAQNTVDLVGLNRFFDSKKRIDRRRKKRADAWGVAQRAFDRHCANLPIDSKDVESIRELALQTGFFSLWITVFKDIHNVRIDLISAFLGTRLSCYDSVTGEPIRDLQL